MPMLKLNVQQQDVIQILSVDLVEPGIDAKKDSLEAIFDCSVTWCPIDTDKHVAQFSKNLTSSDKILILGISKKFITPGVYKKTPLDFGKIAFEQA